MLHGNRSLQIMTGWEGWSGLGRLPWIMATRTLQQKLGFCWSRLCPRAVSHWTLEWANEYHSYNNTSSIARNICIYIYIYAWSAGKGVDRNKRLPCACTGWTGGRPVENRNLARQGVRGRGPPISGRPLYKV